MAKPSDRRGPPLCGFCASAPLTKTPISTHDRCPVARGLPGHECICAAHDHEPHPSVVKRVALACHTTADVVKGRWFG